MPDFIAPSALLIAFPNEEAGTPYLWHRYELVDTGNLGEAPDPEPVRSLPPAISQRDPRFAQERYAPAGRQTFAGAGCLTVAFCSLAQWAGYDVEPVEFARSIAGAYSGDYLTRPVVISQVYPRLRWYTNPHWTETTHIGGELPASSFVDWSKRPASVKLLRELLDAYPVVVQLDFKPATSAIDTHFVLAYEYVPAPDGGQGDDLMIMDPWTGTHVSAIETYWNPAWDAWMEAHDSISRVARLVTGARIMEVQAE